jgi:hypothetical protein
MFGNHFYHQILRKLVVAFGTTFNNIVIHRTNSSDEVTQSIRVPLAYGPKEKFLVRLDQQPNLTDSESANAFAITLPRLGFEINTITYDASRKLNKTQKFRSVRTGSDGVVNYNYSPVPYNISFNLYSFTATAEDGLQIVEQILPFFQPDYTLTVKLIPQQNITRDVPLILNNITYDDTYSGNFTTRRAVIYTMAFTAKTYLFGPTSQQKIIKTTQADQYTDTNQATAKREQRITVTPNPTNADADDDFGFSITRQFFTDAKDYNPSTDSDE